MSRLYDMAERVAELSECRYKFGAVIAAQSKPLSFGVNTIKTHPMNTTYGDHCISIHAEMSAVLRSKTDLKGATIYVARNSINKNSRPCVTCRAHLKEAGIRYMVYHDGSGIVREKL